MTRQEKIAWYNLAVLALALTGCIVLFMILHVYKQDFTLMRKIQVSFSFVGICGLWGLSPLIFRENITKGITEDERDLAIARRAKFIGHLIFWLFFCSTTMGVWGAFNSMGIDKISVDFLPFLVFMGMVILVMSQSIALLLLYRRGNVN